MHELLSLELSLAPLLFIQMLFNLYFYFMGFCFFEPTVTFRAGDTVGVPVRSPSEESETGGSLRISNQV